MNNFTQNNSFGNNYMNFGKKPREIDATIESKLKEYIPTSMKIVVTAVMGDQEALQFAHKIKDFLSENDYRVEGVAQAIYDKSITKTRVEINSEEQSVNVIVGSNL